MKTTIERLEQRASELGKVKPGAKVGPGIPATFTEACASGDCIRQGDLYIVIVASVPAGYVQVEKTTVADKQLVPGNTQGARHCLDSLVGVKMYRPAKWDAESLEGPVLVIAKKRTVLHPTHGSVTLLPGTIVECRYQREWSKEEAKERRARD